MKKIISLFLCFILLMSYPVMTFAEGTDEISKTEDFIPVLTKLNIIPKTVAEGDMDAYVTRAEFASYAAALIKNQGAKDKRYFSDVSSEHWALGYINALVDLGAVSLAPDGKFNPDSNVTYEQACKILMSVSGYREFAAPSYSLAQYVQVAINTGVGIKYPFSEPLTLGAAIELLYNTLTVQMPRNDSLNDDFQNILSIYHSGYEAKGTVDGVYGIGMENSVYKPGYAYISGEYFAVDSDVTLEEYFGEVIEFVYVENKHEDTKTVIFAKPKYDNKTVTIEADLIKSYNESTGVLEYYASEDTSKVKSVTISGKSVFVYNGALMQNSFKDRINEFVNDSKKGTIKIVEDSGIGYDTVIIKSYETFVANAYDDEILYNAYNGNKNLNLQDYKIVRVKSKYENDITLPQSFPDAFSVAISEDKSILEIYVADELQKTVTAFTDDAVSLDGEEYRVDKALADKIMPILTVGASVKIKVDAFGEIIHAEKMGATTDFQLGYITKMHYSDEGVENLITMRVFQKATGFKSFDIKDKLLIDGKRYEIADVKKIVSAFPGINTYDGQYKITIEPQLIRFKTDLDGVVKEIDTYNVGETEDKNYTLTRTANGEKEMRYWGEDKRYGELDMVDSNTLVLTVPAVDSNGLATVGGVQVKPTDNMYKTGASVYADYTYYIEAYYYTNRFIADAIIVKSKTDKYAGNLCMFDELNTVWNESTESVELQFVGYSKGGKTTYIVSDSAKEGVKTLSKGDVVRVGTLTTDTSVMTDIEKHFDVKTMSFVGSSSSTEHFYVGSSLRSTYNLAKMYAYDTRGTILRGSYKLYDAADDIANMAVNTNNTDVFIYDKELKTNQIYEGTINEIKTYKMYGENCDLILYNVNGVTSPAIFAIRR